MITIRRTGKDIQLVVVTDLPGAMPHTITAYTPNIKCCDEPMAALLHRYLDNRLAEALSKIRQDAYVQGWKDAKAKTRKCTWFSGRF